MKSARLTFLAWGSLLILGGGAAYAQNVTLSGMLGARALLVVDGAPPKSVGVGESYRGVKVLSTQADQAVVEIDGERQTLRMGETPARLLAQSRDAGADKIVLHAGSNGHFVTAGQINGRTVQFMVDTGASYVGLSVADAERIGLNYKTGQLIGMGTANGPITGWLVKLSSVRVGQVQLYEVDAVITPGAMSYVLLGNSFLTRFQMARTNEQLVLEKRY
jgi:aspartyl protease family protein